MEEMDVIDRFLETFMAYIDSGFGLLAGDVAYLTTTLIVIDITLAGLFWALSQTADVIAGLLKKVLYVGFFAFILGNFSILANILFASFAELGVKAGSSTLTAGDLMRPGYIAGVGFEAAFPLLADIGDMLGPISFFHNLVPIAVMLLAWLVILIAFFVLASRSSNSSSPHLPDSSSSPSRSGTGPPSWPSASSVMSSRPVSN